MENNEICMSMDVKLDINDKRPLALKFKHWTRCQVKIEAIKCLPCYLRINIKPCELSAGSSVTERISIADQQSLSCSVIVPGVSISLANSRSKQFAYELFWTQNRRNCFIYFALDTESSCRRHMRWIKKSIENLELYRKVLLEERRISRDSTPLNKCMSMQQGVAVGSKFRNYSSIKPTLGTATLPKLADALVDSNSTSWSRRISRASDIYEEIFEGTLSGGFTGGGDAPRLSRRLSHTSIASGIYEEMKPFPNNFNAIFEEITQDVVPPPVPPLPPPRKRINTFQNDGLLGEIPRSNTNPECELAKKKKYKNMLDNIFGSGRSKRAESLSESQACLADDLIATTPKQAQQKSGGSSSNMAVSYVNNDFAAKRRKKPPHATTPTLTVNRNSFSSPDLSKINFLDAFDEQQVADIFNNSFTSDGLNLEKESLDDSPIFPLKKPEKLLARIRAIKSKADSRESLNISEQIPNNFNFSACNTSTINLVGSNGAAQMQTTNKNKILIDDTTGYCVMAPIKKKVTPAPLTGTESASSGYSTSASSSSANSAESRLGQAAAAPTDGDAVKLRQQSPVIEEESVVYEKMLYSLNSTSSINLMTPPSSVTADFTGNLYENLLAVKAAQELETPPLPAKSAAATVITLTTSTPTEMNGAHAAAVSTEIAEDEESFYQTPRKSIISVDEKIPSYYPNSCEATATLRRSSYSPAKANSATTTPTASSVPCSACNTSEKSTKTLSLRHLVNIKIRRERKENLYISPASPGGAQTADKNGASTSTTNSNKSSNKNKNNKKTAYKISENVYAVKHLTKKTNKTSATTITTSSTTTTTTTNNNEFSDEMKEKLQTELLQLAMLQKIDFKFDETRSVAAIGTMTPAGTAIKQTLADSALQENVDVEYENCFQATKSASRLLQKYAANINGSPPKARPTTTTTTPQRVHHLQLNQASNTTTPTTTTKATNPTSGSKTTPNNSDAMTQSKLLEAHGSGGSAGGGTDAHLNTVKKFTSLPRFKKIDFSPLKLRINNVLQRHHQPQNEF